jgi:hypothetical protein
MMAQIDRVVVGIDVAKDKVDVCIRRFALRQVFPNTAPPAATVSVVAETSEISVSDVMTTIAGLFAQVPCRASSKSSSATPKAISPATSPPASSSTSTRSVTWRSGRISELMTVLGLAARLDDVSRTALKTGFAGITPKVASRVFESLTRFVDCRTGIIRLLEKDRRPIG